MHLNIEFEFSFDYTSDEIYVDENIDAQIEIYNLYLSGKILSVSKKIHYFLKKGLVKYVITYKAVFIPCLMSMQEHLSITFSKKTPLCFYIKGRVN